MKLYRNGQTTTALERLQQIVQAHADTGARWRAQESAAHLLVKSGGLMRLWSSSRKLSRRSQPRPPVPASWPRACGEWPRFINGSTIIALRLSSTLPLRRQPSPPRPHRRTCCMPPARFLKSHSKWTTPGRSRPPKVGNRYSKSLSPHADAAVTSEVAAIADLMLVETLSWSRRFEDTVASSTALMAPYPPDRFYQVHWTLAYCRGDSPHAPEALRRG